MAAHTDGSLRRPIVNIARIDNKLLVVTEEVGVSAYDFNFEAQ